ncbi:Hypothetical_protein [Hexamita inflata]|uniref:Hypothetical_protein n=1 Tax=Hexamita inflata TaxID=28002 RepID=A0AA86R1F2_9EUKA|nr:Hypothetical protein HINF_LOCUS48385 [Hexamita inflata]
MVILYPSQTCLVYAKFVENRRIRITMNLKFDTNGINTIITKEFDNILAKDTHNCKTHDSHLAMYAVLNSDSVQLQFRDSFINILECDLPSVVTARVDIYLYDNVNKIRYCVSPSIFKETLLEGAKLQL